MIYNCTCCGSQVTVPYFHNGGVYGYTCIRKVKPNAKRAKASNAGLWVRYNHTICEQGRALIVVLEDGTKLNTGKFLNPKYAIDDSNPNFNTTTLST